MATKNHPNKFRSAVANGLANVPKTACRFDAQAPAIGKTTDGKTPITLVARSGGAIDHWWWGRVYHDMAGFKSPPKIPLDYCHCENEIIGFGDKFTPANDGLTVEGTLVSIAELDRADEITKKSVAGVPYQASIFFDPLRIEDVLPGATATVNGQTVQGPSCIIREWMLDGLAVCPYGADRNTSAMPEADSEDELTAGKNKFKGALKVPVTLTNGATMSTETKPEPKPEPNHRAEFAAELSKFTGKFGAENGAKWFSEGKSFSDALELHVAALADELKAAKESHAAELKKANDQIAELTKKLGAVNLGENPAQFTDGDPKPGSANTESKPKINGLSEGLSKFAAGITLPTK